MKLWNDIFKKHRVLICVGSGGVGKTTLSAGLGILAAQNGLRVLVMTIDPSRRLKVALGLTESVNEDTRVPNQSYKGQIYATILNAEAIFEKFVTASAKDQLLGQRLLKNRLYKQLSTTLSGSQEFTSLLQLTQVIGDSKYDLVILDTPPAQHAIDFLEAPEKINSLFQEGIVKWFIGDESEGGLIRRIISKGTRTVLSALEAITGNQFMHELIDFFESAKAVQHRIAQKTSSVQDILHSDSTGFLLVTGFDKTKLEEADQLNKYLSSRNYYHLGTVINKAYIAGLTDGLSSEEASHSEEHQRWVRYQSERELIFSKYIEKWRYKLPVVRLPDINNDISGLKGLEEVANALEMASDSSSN